MRTSAQRRQVQKSGGASAGSRADKNEPVSMPADDCRNAGQWSFTDAIEILSSDAPAGPSTLACPQRLTIADELAGDAAELANGEPGRTGSAPMRPGPVRLRSAVAG